MSVLLGLIDKKIVRILATLAANPEEHFHIQKLSSVSKLALSTTFRIINKLVKQDLIEITIIGKFKIYKIKTIKKLSEISQDILLGLIDKKIVRILATLAANPEEHFHIQKLSYASKLPLSTTFRIVNKLVRLDLIEVIVIGKFKIYRLKQNERTKEIIQALGGKK